MYVMADVTHILSAMENGDPSASDKLLPLVYDELRVLAHQRLAKEKPGQTLQATALVHEAYLRLVGKDQDQSWDNRGHFFGAAAQAMRRILVDQARRKAGPKAGGDRTRMDISIDEIKGNKDQEIDLLALDDALDALATKDPRKAELVKLRFFAGLTIEQAAKSLGISERTAFSDWAYAKCWLRAEMLDNTSPQD